MAHDPPADMQKGKLPHDLYTAPSAFENRKSLIKSGSRYSEVEVLQATGTANVFLTGSIDNNRIIGNAGNADPTVDGIIQVSGVHTVDASWFFL
jgi:hypothetical protein